MPKKGIMAGMPNWQPVEGNLVLGCTKLLNDDQFFISRYVYEHSERHGFPSEWIGCTFSVTTFWNGILAILAGELFSNKQVVPKNRLKIEISLP